MVTAIPERTAAKPKLGQLTRLDLLALAVQRVPGMGDETAAYYGSMSKDGLIDPLTRGGLSFDCGNGLHAPLCDGRNCSCSCHRSAA